MQFFEHKAGGSNQDLLEIVDRVSGVKELFRVAIDKRYPTVSVPPSPPSRVVQQAHFIRVEDGGTGWERTPILLDSIEERSFEMRRAHKIRETSASAVFAWYCLKRFRKPGSKSKDLYIGRRRSGGLPCRIQEEAQLESPSHKRNQS